MAVVLNILISTVEATRSPPDFFCLHHKAQKRELKAGPPVWDRARTISASGDQLYVSF
jgi:hypothetical protein